MQARNLWLIVAILVLAVIAMFGKDLLDSQQDRQYQETVAAEPGCDLQQGSCEARFTDNTLVSLGVTPRPIVALQPLQLALQVGGGAFESAAVRIEGVNMDMGYNHFLFKKTAGGFAGEVILPVCTLSVMQWRLYVILTDSKQRKIRATFPLQTRRSP